jgi:CheY-like chemotaxis protein
MAKLVDDSEWSVTGVLGQPVAAGCNGTVSPRSEFIIAASKKRRMLSSSNARRVAPSAPSSSRANMFEERSLGSSLMGALRARVLVVDDSDVFLRAAASVISATSTLRLVGAVGSGKEAIRLLPRLRPDLVLLDFQMPGMDGIQTTRIIRRKEPRTVVIVISADLAGRSDAARAAGAATTLDKRDFVPRTLDALWLEHMPDGSCSASTRSSERRMIALRQANRVRKRRAKLKQDLREGKVRLEQILATRADYLVNAEVFDLLVAVPKVGPVKAGRLLTNARISRSKTIGELSERQQACLIELLSR